MRSVVVVLCLQHQESCVLPLHPGLSPGLSVPMPDPTARANIGCWTVDTDYKSYTVTYNCVQILELREETAFILTRDPNPAPEVVSINPSLLCSISIILNLSR